MNTMSWIRNKAIPYVLAGLFLAGSGAYAQDRLHPRLIKRSPPIEVNGGYVVYGYKSSDTPVMVAFSNTKMGQRDAVRKYIGEYQKYQQRLRDYWRTVNDEKNKVPNTPYKQLKDKDKQDGRITAYPMMPMPPPTPEGLEPPIIFYRGFNPDQKGGINHMQYFIFDKQEPLVMDIQLFDNNDDGNPDLGQIVIKEFGIEKENIVLNKDNINSLDNVKLKGNYYSDVKDIMDRMKSRLADAKNSFHKLNMYLEDEHTKRFLDGMIKDMDRIHQSPWDQMKKNRFQRKGGGRH